MEIQYKCKRCKRIVTAKVTESKFKSLKGGGKVHNRLDCTVCGKYIKFIGERELYSILKSGDRNEKYSRIFKSEKSLNLNFVSLEEINFKIDLILDHLGIKTEG